MKASFRSIVSRLRAIAYHGLYVGAQRFNDVRWRPLAGLEGRDCYAGTWHLLDVEEMTDCNGRAVSI